MVNNGALVTLTFGGCIVIDLMTVGAAAKLLNVSTDWVRVLADRGDLPTIHAGKVRLFQRAEVERLAEQRASRNGRDA